MLVNQDSKQIFMEAKVANTRYKPFAGLPPQVAQDAAFICMGKVKETHQRNGQHRRTKIDINSYCEKQYLNWIKRITDGG